MSEENLRGGGVLENSENEGTYEALPCEGSPTLDITAPIDDLDPKDKQLIFRSVKIINRIAIIKIIIACSGCLCGVFLFFCDRSSVQSSCCSCSDTEFLISGIIRVINVPVGVCLFAFSLWILTHMDPKTKLTLTNPDASIGNKDSNKSSKAKNK